MLLNACRLRLGSVRKLLGEVFARSLLRDDLALRSGGTALYKARRREVIGRERAIPLTGQRPMMLIV